MLSALAVVLKELAVRKDGRGVPRSAKHVGSDEEGQTSAPIQV